MSNTLRYILEVIFLLSLISKSFQIKFYLKPNTHKCLSEEIRKDVLISGDYEVQQIHGQSVEIQVVDSKEQILYTKPEASVGKFLFNTEHDEHYRICFVCRAAAVGRPSAQEISLVTKHGVEAKSYEALGEANKLKPLEVEMKRLEDLSESIVQHFSYMREREEQMRDTNESTNSRVLYFSLFSLCCLIALATWQVLYLRKFFKSKKLIE